MSIIGKVYSQQDLDDTFQPPFKSCVVDGYVSSVMCSYNQVNRKPTCGNPDLLSGVIRGQWKLNGAGFLTAETFSAITLQLQSTKAYSTETEISRAWNNFITMMRLGFIDGDPTKQLYGKLGPKDVCA
ncbi:hypothetical protein CASFOL_022750 [Castilleja foliolosa]|uniref:Glycoside hydrolase family 3 N-terminal domain-containing protein n=1 Tax=Castilleja foliolosa TaxID=1961234 RepID=A0ABD3CTA8_9LAMI